MALFMSPQAHCTKCNVPIGMHHQGPAYASRDGGWLCEKHIEQEWKQMVDASARKTDRLSGRDNIKL